MKVETYYGGQVIATGGWPDLRKHTCKSSPNAKHSFSDFMSKPSTRPGERLVTSKCKWCGAIIKDCPTFNA